MFMMAILRLGSKITSLSEGGEAIKRLNISVPSTISSIITGTLIVVLLVPAMKVAVMGSGV